VAAAAEARALGGMRWHGSRLVRRVMVNALHVSARGAPCEGARLCRSGGYCSSSTRCVSGLLGCPVDLRRRQGAISGCARALLCPVSWVCLCSRPHCAVPDHARAWCAMGRSSRASSATRDLGACSEFDCAQPYRQSRRPTMAFQSDICHAAVSEVVAFWQHQSGLGASRRRGSCR